MAENLEEFVKSALQLENIEVSGLGVSLNCLHGVLPTKEKLQELIDHRDRLEEKLDISLPVVSGGSSVMIPLFFEDQIPEGITHFRVGETLYFGNNLITGEPIEGMKQNAIQLHSNIIEMKEKPLIPWGELGMNVMGEKKEFDEDLKGKSSYRAIVDVGQIDVSPDFMTPIDDSLDIIGASSDMMVINLHDNPNNYQTGDYITWNIDYIGTVQLMNSPYVDKKLKDGSTQ
jgi:predicted amino acid racemase